MHIVSCKKGSDAIMSRKSLTGFVDTNKPQTTPDYVSRWQFYERGKSNKSYVIEFWQKEGVMRLAYGPTEAPERTECVVIASMNDVQEQEDRRRKKGYQSVSASQADIDSAAKKLNTAALPATVDNNPQHHSLAIKPAVMDLVKLVFSANQTKVNSFLTKKVDSLSLEAINKGRSLLVQASHIFKSNPTDSRIIDLSEEYFMHIPTQLPRFKNRPIIDEAVKIFTDFVEQEDRLNQLEAALATLQYSNTQNNYRYDPVIAHYMSLGITIDVFEPGQDNYDLVIEKFSNTMAVSGRKEAKIIKAYMVTIPNERANFVNTYQNWENAYPKVNPNVVHLFHGTARHNVQHILKTGLIVPKTAANGRRLGDGIYFGPTSVRSLYYTDYVNDKRSQLPYLMFVNQVILGKGYEVTGLYSGSQPPKGYHSVFAPTTNSGRGGEHVVFQTSQQTARILLMLEPN